MTFSHSQCKIRLGSQLSLSVKSGLEKLQIDNLGENANWFQCKVYIATAVTAATATVAEHNW